MTATATAETSTPPTPADPDLAALVERILSNGRRLGLSIQRVCIYIGLSQPSLQKAKRGDPVSLATRRRVVEGDRVLATAQSAADLRVPA